MDTVSPGSRVSLVHVRRVELAGLPIVEITPAQLVNSLIEAVQNTARTEPYLVGYLNAHVFNTCWEYPAVYRLLQRADVVYADGASIGWAARLTGQRPIARATSADWLAEVLVALAERGHKLFLLGGNPGLAAQYQTKVSASHPALVRGICGTMHGFFAQEEEEALMQSIADSRAQILIVGMGTPWQEQFILRNLERLPVAAVWWIGAGMEYAVGTQTRGPTWTRAIGHEWLGRLLSDPIRLARRYLLGNPLFLWRVLTRARPTLRPAP